MPGSLLVCDLHADIPFFRQGGAQPDKHSEECTYLPIWREFEICVVDERSTRLTVLTFVPFHRQWARVVARCQSCDPSWRSVWSAVLDASQHVKEWNGMSIVRVDTLQFDPFVKVKALVTDLIDTLRAKSDTFELEKREVHRCEYQIPQLLCIHMPNGARWCSVGSGPDGHPRWSRSTREKGADPRTEHGAKKLQSVRLLTLPVSSLVSLLFCAVCRRLRLFTLFFFLCDGRRPQNWAFFRLPLLIRFQP